MAGKKPDRSTPATGRGATDRSGRPVATSGSTSTKGGRSRADVVAEFQRQQVRSARRGRLVTASMVVVAVVIVAVVVVFVSVDKDKGSGSTAAGTSGLATAATVAAVTGVPASVLNTVGIGTASNAPTPVTGDPLTSDGKPRILYVGGEFCPYCAAERWPMTVALSRFGTFAHLGQTASGPDDVYPDTPTLSFHGATYTSEYVSFTGVEQVDREQKPLDTLSSADNALLTKYDTHDHDTPIPFIDVGGAYTSSGASYSPDILAGMTQDQVAAALADPTSGVAKAIDGSANVFTAAICGLTQGQPTTVCQASGVRAASSVLTASS